MGEILPIAKGIHAHEVRKLGKAPRRHDPRTLRMVRYMDLSKLPPAPVSCNLMSKVTNLGSMLNNDIGDCTVAGAAHMVQCWTAQADKQYIIPDAQVQAAYSAITGYNPADASTDNGAVEIDVLNYWRKTGIDSHQIGAYAALPINSPTTLDYLKQSIFILGAAYAGFDLPTYVQDAAQWVAPSFYQKARGWANPGSWGGHAVPFVAYDVQFFYVVSWGEIVPVAYSFVTEYCDEIYGVLSQDQLCDNGLTPAGLNNQQLSIDLQLIAA